MKRASDQINAFFGKDTEFDGKLSFTGTVRIDGRFKGQIVAEGTLIVGETAVVDSDIQVSQIIVSGRIQGNIVAQNRMEVHAPGKVFGNIRSPVLIIEEGVIFEGNCRMQKDAEVADRKVAMLTGNPAIKNGSH
jgi:cytoskeletal protein CcmA (bactofilin family)